MKIYFSKLIEYLIDAFEYIFDYDIGLFTDLKVIKNGSVNEFEDENWYFYKKLDLNRYDGTVIDNPEIIYVSIC